jgi:TonB family protein
MFRAFLCVAFLLQATAPPPYVAARYVAGALPPVPIRAVGGGEVWLEVPVTRDGVIPGIKVLRATPPFTEALTTAVNGWRFAPAEQDVPPVPGAPPVSPAAREHVDATVLVAAVFLPPTLNAPTLGEAPKDLAAPSSPGTPVPVATTRPSYPPRALMSGVVLVEVRVAPSGDVAEAKVISSAPSFDQPALDAALQWKFRPGRVRGAAVEAFAYIAFGFAQPITSR